ncbi:MAG: DEAD/DEAH box helicase [Methyloceanibacter sp.]|nr:DEAD/DEAH box helicase [Methyloceanibacter sp.]
MTTSFNLLGLAEPLRLALKAENYTTPTPIQLQAIPTLIRGRDLLGVAETGTGKTAAFALPLLHRLFINRSEPATPTAPRALVLAPTRELAGQIAERVNAYGRNLNIRTAVIFGGVNQSKQVNALRTGVDILIATPGRLLDLCAQRHVRLDKVSMLVLDEADRMLDMGFIRDVRKIVGFCRKDRQTLLFSATMPPSIAKLAHDILRNPVRVDISPAKVAVERIEQRVYFVGAKDKRTVLTDLLKAPKMDRAIVFTRTKRGADRVCRHLVQAGLAANAIHGNKAQNARVRALDGFRKGKVRILVATDIAARGIDVPGVSHVINFELPNDPESYVHRVGRTGRAGAQGTALSLCDHNERSYLKTIERLMQESIEVAEHPLAMMADQVATRDSPSREATRQGNRRRKRTRNRRPHRTSPAATKSSRKSEALI